MSHSFKKTKIFAYTNAKSEKQDKKIFHKKFRSKERDILKKIEQYYVDFDEIVFYNKDEIYDVWGMEKDGKHYWENASEKDMRK